MTVSVIAVGYDHSEDARLAARFALGLAAQTRARVVFVHAIGLRAHYEGESWPDVLPAELAAMAAEAGVAAERVSWHAEDGDACSVLLRCDAEPVAADLVVVGSRGQNAHAGMVLGSTSMELSERSRIALVIVPSGRAPA